MVVYGYRRDFFNGRDLYGFDYAVKVLQEVLQAAPGAGLVILCPSASRKDPEWQPLIEDVWSRRMGDRVMFLFKPLEDPFALWQGCSVMLRPTVTDGDSVAVREMLTLGLPVIASDIAPRPAGARVLALESPAEWARAVIEYNLSGPQGLTVPLPPTDGYDAIRKVLLACAERGR
jgi:glycosyltransferase involved in cell wall biosynthesis